MTPKIIIFVTYILCIFGILSAENEGVVQTYNIHNNSKTSTNTFSQSRPRTNNRSEKQHSFGILHTLNKFSEWSVKEEEIVELLGKRAAILEEEVKYIKIYLEDYVATTGKAMEGIRMSQSTPSERGKVIGSSAVLGHRMASRYSTILTGIRNLLASPEYTQIYENTRNLLELIKLNTTTSASPSKKSFSDKGGHNLSNFPVHDDTNESRPQEVEGGVHKWPDWEDKYMSALSILHIHGIFGYHPAALRFGLNVDTENGGSLNALQCAEIGMFALYRKYYYMAVEWLEVARDLLIVEESDSSIELNFVKSLLKVAIFEHNEGLVDKNRYFDIFKNFFTQPIYEGELPRPRMRITKAYFQETFALGEKGDPDSQFLGLCSRGMRQTPEMQINLKCFYERRHPYLYINPIKTEILSEKPPLKQFYEIISNSTIEKVKNISESELALSQIVGDDDLENITDLRTSVGSFIANQSEVLELYKISEFVSGLKIIGNFSEPSQFVEYSYGRYYIWHTDALEQEEQTLPSVLQYGDRLATMLFQLELPEFGGRTPFCFGGVSAHQVRGSAILWYNLYRNGTARQDVNHGACPIVHGHKMIINHWIRYNGNWDHHKCSRDQFDELNFE